MRTTAAARCTLAIAFALLVGSVAQASPALAASRATTRVNLTGARHEAALQSLTPSISQDGRYVAFASLASTLVASGIDTNHSWDIFLRDRLDGTTILVSMNSARTHAGDQGSGGVNGPSISADGRYIAFESFATDLVSGSDANAASDVFVYDRVTGTTVRASVDMSGGDSNGSSTEPRLSADGRHVAFTSVATDLTAGGASGFGDVFVRDLGTGETVLASVAVGGLSANQLSDEPSLSHDGRYVAFSSTASNLVTADANGHVSDVFRRDLLSGETILVSVNTAGAQADVESVSPFISADGDHVAFVTAASTFVLADANDAHDVFVRDVGPAQTSCISVTLTGVPGSGTSQAPSISHDGNVITFQSDADDLVTGDSNDATDIFLRDRGAGATTMASVSSAGVPGNTNSYAPSLSADGLSVAFESESTNLVSADRNGMIDIFVNEEPRSPGVGTPHAASKMSRLKYYTVYGYLKPWHASGTYPVRIYKERYVSGHWKKYGYVKAKAADYKGYTKYSVKMRLQYKGRWRLQARTLTDTGHISVWSTGYDYVTVK